MKQLSHRPGEDVRAIVPGIAPAFFTRVDHPLHWLDRGRWIVCCMCLTGLLLMLGVVKWEWFGENRRDFSGIATWIGT